MYTEFYNLREKPFELTSSPKFLYLGETHKEALALLTYGVVERKGFILLTGEVGTGKTTMIRALLAGLDDGVKFVHVSNPLFTPMDFMNYLASSTFKKNVHFKSKAAFLIEFEGFLRQCFQHQKNFILIVDEAQNLSLQLLEEIRLLSNLETADEKLINIFLVGQPELNEKLRRPECKPLLQRISVRHHIKPLDPEGTGEYIATRLELAGAEKPNKIFPADVGRLIHEFSGGYPRLINILADNALLLGYSRGKRKITPSIVKQCYQDMRLEGPLAKIGTADKRGRSGGKQIKAPLRGRRWLWAALLLGLLGVIVADIRTGQSIVGRLTSDVVMRFQAVLNRDPGGVPVSVSGKVTQAVSADAPASVFTVHVASFEAFDQAFDMSRKLRERGYDGFVMPVEEEKSGEVFRVGVGNFDSESEAGDYARMILQNGLSNVAKVMRLEMK